MSESFRVVPFPALGATPWLPKVLTECYHPDNGLTTGFDRQPSEIELDNGMGGGYF